MTSIAALGSALVARTSRQLCSLRSAAAAGSTQRSQGSLSPPTTSATRARSDGPIGMPGVGPLWQSLAPSPTQLDKVVKMETFAGQTTEYIKNTWLKFHEDERKGRVGWVLSRQEYKTLLRNAEESPIFVVPLEKPEGYVTLVVQFQFKDPKAKVALFTTLDDFRKGTFSASPHLTLTHYAELAKRDAILVRGDVTTPKIINAFEARALIQRVYQHYLDPEKYARWVRTFNHSSRSFDFNAYIKTLGFLA